MGKLRRRREYKATMETLVWDLAILISTFIEREKEFIVFMDITKKKFEELEATMGSLQ